MICELNLYTKCRLTGSTVSWRVKNRVAPRNGPRIQFFRRPNVGNRFPRVEKPISNGFWRFSVAVIGL